MKVLLVFPFLPWPPNDGGRIGFFNPIKYLSSRLDVVVASLISPNDMHHSAELKKHCLDLCTCPAPSTGRLLSMARGCFFAPPGAAAKYWHPQFGEIIRAAIRKHNPDVVEFHHLNTAAYVSFARGLPTLLRQHNVEYMIWERHSQFAANWIEHIYLRRCAPRVRAYEAAMARQFARCIMVSEADARHLMQIAPTANVEVIPSGVDTSYFYPRPEIEEEPDSVVMTGSFEWKPKQHNLRVLVDEIFPKIRARVPGAKLYIIGKGVPHQLKRVVERMPGVVVTGLVSDVRPYVWRASLVVNYLESGGGIALKVLEAMAMRKPVLSNSLGCEGIKVHHGRNAFIADGVEQFADAAVLLLKNEALRQRLADSGYESIQGHYDWHSLAGRFEECYRSVIEERRHRTGVAVSPAV